MGKSIHIKILKDENGGVKEVIWDADGYHGQACEKDMERLMESLKSLGIELKIKNMEKKPEYYELVEEEETVQDYEAGL